jgi:hypothetical protein
VGEYLAVHSDDGEYEVIKVVWHAVGNGLVANVHVEDTKGGTRIA